MAKVLAAFVHVVGEDGETVVLAAGDVLPEWAEGLITNPGAFIAEDEATQIVEQAQAAPSTTPVVPANAAGTDNPPAPTVTTVEPADYSEIPFPKLQAASKERGLSGAGSADVLIARLQADDRDKAAEAAAEAVKTAADLAAADAPQF